MMTSENLDQFGACQKAVRWFDLVVEQGPGFADRINRILSAATTKGGLR